MYGWRAKIGLITAVGESAEHAFHTYAPNGVTFSSMKIPAPDVTPSGLYTMSGYLEETAGRFKGYDLDLLVFGCEAASCYKGKDFDQICARQVRDASGIPSLTSSTAALEALRAVGAKKVAVLTPYPEDTNQREKKFLEENGFEVTNIVGMDMSQFLQRGRTFEAASDHFLYEYTRTVDLQGADTFFLCSMQLATMELIPSLETLLKVPVITSHQATLWSALRHANIYDKMPVLGTLGSL